MTLEYAINILNQHKHLGCEDWQLSACNSIKGGHRWSRGFHFRSVDEVIAIAKSYKNRTEPQPDSETTERSEFEKWTKVDLNLKDDWVLKRTNNEYNDLDIRLRWQGWIARSKKDK